VRNLIVVAFIVVFGSYAAQAEVPSVMGTWLTASKVAKIRIAPCADPARGPVCGMIVGLIDPKGPDGQVVAPEAATDYHNSDPALRGRKVLGMLMMYDFKTTSDPNGFEEGTIYNGDNGKTYRAKIGLQPDGTLRLRGYVGTPLFGETQVWTRIP
jgi:uncharacterized protein (DUF2147 family)